MVLGSLHVPGVSRGLRREGWSCRQRQGQSPRQACPEMLWESWKTHLIWGCVIDEVSCRVTEAVPKPAQSAARLEWHSRRGMLRWMPFTFCCIVIGCSIIFNYEKCWFGQSFSFFFRSLWDDPAKWTRNQRWNQRACSHSNLEKPVGTSNPSVPAWNSQPFLHIAVATSATTDLYRWSGLVVGSLGCKTCHLCKKKGTCLFVSKFDMCCIYCI